jgi:GDPmannose 4,6-dehydratase
VENSYEIMNILSIDEASKHAGGNGIVIITGVTGQDGSFMADYLLKNTKLHIFGGARRLSVSNHENIDHLKNEPRFHLLNFDLTDAHSISQIVSQLKPAYFINFAAQSFVKSSWDFPSQTWDTNTKSIIHILESIRLHCPSCRFYNAGSSEEFGNVAYSPQDEKHPIRPRSPYGASKAAARSLVKVYRESYGLYAIQGWLFNHEGTRRGEDFVTRKITKAVAQIANDISKKQSFETLRLGNLNASRDWSDAEDCVDSVWRMLNQDVYRHDVKELIKEYNQTSKLMLPRNINPAWHDILVKNIREYVVSSNETHTIREFVERSFTIAGIDGYWTGKPNDALSEQFHRIDHPNDILVSIDPSYYRPAEVDILLGCSDLIRSELGWSPKVDFNSLVIKMVSNDGAR